MLLYLAVVSMMLSFISTLYLLYKFIPFFMSIGIKGKDMNKLNHIEVADSGGLGVMFGLVIGSYISLILSFLLNQPLSLKYFHATFLALILLSVLGFLEDLTNLIRSPNFKKIGFKQKYKLLLPLPATLPIVITVFDRTTVSLPLLGNINLGILYPLILVPIGIIGASNATNLLGGLNGLEGSLALINFIAIAIFSYHHSIMLPFYISLSLIGSILAFLIYNWYPSKIFPGDSFNYFVGGTIATLSIVGDFEKFSILLLFIWYIEFLLKLRSKFKAESFGKVNEGGKLDKPYPYIYSLTHIFMNGKRSERDIVIRIVVMQLIISLFLLYLYW